MAEDNVVDFDVEDDEEDTGEGNSDFDKVRQQVQQELGNKIRPLEEKLEKLDNLDDRFSEVLERLEGFSGDKDGNKSSATGEDDDDEFTSILSKSPEDIDPYSASKSLARKISSMEKSVEKIDARVGDVAEAARQSRSESNRSQFSKDHPNLDFDEVLDRTNDRIGDLLGDGDVSETIFGKLAQREFNDVVNEMEFEPGKARKRPSKRPDKDPEGALITRSKGSGSGKKSERDYIDNLTGE